MTKRCDCLNDCGDDPALARSEASPCEDRIRTEPARCDNAAVAAFSVAMRAKLAASREKGKGGWQDPAQCTVEYLAKLLVTAVLKGDPVDVGNFAMMLHQRRASPAVLTQALLEYCQAAQPPLPDPGWTTEGEECWSANGEDFNCDTLEELLAENDQLKPGDTIHVGQAVHPDPANYADANDVIDDVACRGCDDGGESADDYATDVTEEAKAQLNNFLRAWLRTHCPPDFYKVRNTRPYVLTAADFAGRQCSEVQP